MSDIKIKKIIKSPKRLGRGRSSGKGKTAGRGMSGQKSRTGDSTKLFGGGQTSLYRRLPKKRGFKSHRAKNKIALNTAQIGRLFKDTKISEISREDILKKLNIKDKNVEIKIISSAHKQTSKFKNDLRVSKSLESKSAINDKNI